MPLYLHPGAPPADHWRVLSGHPELYGSMWSWAAEVSGHALRVLFSGVFDRHPSATLILGHMGEFCLTSATGWTTAMRPPTPAIGCSVAPRPTSARTSSLPPAASSPRPPLTGAVLEVGADASMFSVDYPYESSREAVDGFERTTLSPGDREKIAHANAERILKL